MAEMAGIDTLPRVIFYNRLFPQSFKNGVDLVSTEVIM